MPNGTSAAVPGDLAGGRALPAREPAGFVKLLVVRQVDLGHDAKQLAPLTDGGDVVELIVHEPTANRRRPAPAKRSLLSASEADQGVTGRRGAAPAAGTGRRRCSR